MKLHAKQMKTNENKCESIGNQCKSILINENQLKTNASQCKSMRIHETYTKIDANPLDIIENQLKINDNH